MNSDVNDLVEMEILEFQLNQSAETSLNSSGIQLRQQNVHIKELESYSAIVICPRNEVHNLEIYPNQEMNQF